CNKSVLREQGLAGSAHIGQPRGELLDFDRDAVSAHDHGALRHREICWRGCRPRGLRRVQIDDGAAAEPEHLVDWLEVVPSTIGISIATLSSVDVLRRDAMPEVTPYGWRMVNRRELTFGLAPAPGLPPAEWRLADGRVPYEHALAVMEE